MPVPQGEITTTETMNNLVPESYGVLKSILWEQWKETLSYEPGYMAGKILEELEQRGWKLVKNE
jgi:hypothetical protein